MIQILVPSERQTKAVEREGMKSSTLRPCWYGNWDRLLADHRA